MKSPCGILSYFYMSLFSNKEVPYNVYLINSHISFEIGIRIQRVKLERYLST